MLHLAYLLSTAAIAAVAIPLLDAKSAAEHVSAASEPSQITIQMPAVQASTISSNAASRPTPAQRWVF
jgi:hypothetical protein